MRTYLVIITFILISVFSCQQLNNKTPAPSESGSRANALIHETSPYLLQHAYNPVDWKGWNDETLELAKTKNKLIVISIGYSACHWCHVMEEESFENDSVAKIMNDNYISIKVDREERPDIDQIYMEAVQLMTGNGGWPLNCIALPDGRPIFGGTYFTTSQWIEVIENLAELYEKNPEKVISYAEEFTHGIINSEIIALNKLPAEFESQHLKSIIKPWLSNLDLIYGGQKGSPKFPMPNNLDFLLRYSFHNDDKEIESAVMTTLTKMASGGIYDQIGGGFSRYSVDEKWHIPHFEKMLYDNAQLVSMYSKAYTLTKNELFKKTIIETLEFVERELTNSDGAFYSSINADSQNKDGDMQEGVFYSWSKSELETLLGDDFPFFKDYYNVNAFGKWEHDQYVLIKRISDQEFANKKEIDINYLTHKISAWKKILFNARQKRMRPSTDNKILTSWNALMIKAYVDAYRALGNTKYLESATMNADFIINEQLQDTNELYHSYKDGKSSIRGFAEDYAMVIDAFLALYEVSLEESRLNTANDLMKYAIVHFKTPKNGMFYFTSDEEKNLIVRKTEVVDNVIPSSNSVLAMNLFKLGHYYGNSDFVSMSKQMLNNMKFDFEKSASSYSMWLALYLNYSNPFYEVAVSGLDAEQKIQEITKNYVPNILVAGATTESDIPLMENRYNKDETFIYVCVNSSCQLPETDVKKALAQLVN